MVLHLTTNVPRPPAAGFDFGDIGYMIRRHLKLSLGCTAGFVLVALLMVLLAQPSFTATGALYLGDASTPGELPPNNTPLGFTGAFAADGDVSTQVALLQARSLIDGAVLETGLNATVTRAGQGSLSYWRWRLLHHGSIDAFAPRPGDLSVRYTTLADADGVGGAGQFILVTDKAAHYHIVARQGLFTDRTILSGVYGAPASGGGLSLVVAPAIADALPAPGMRFHLAIQPADAIASRLLADNRFRVTLEGTLSVPTKVAALGVTWDNPFAARDFLDQLMRDYIATQLAWKTQTASTTEDFISGQLDKIRGSLTDADRNLSDYQSKTGIVDVPDDTRAAIEQLSGYEVQRADFSLRIKALQTMSDELTKPSNGLSPYLASQTDDPVLDQLSEQLATAQQKLGGLQAQFTAQAEDVKTQGASVRTVERSILSLVKNDLALDNAQLEKLNGLIGTLQARLNAMPGESLHVMALTRSSDVLGQLYVLLMEKQQEAQISKAATSIDTRVLTAPALPLGSSSPRPLLTLGAGLFFGLFASLASILAKRSFSGRFQNEEEIMAAAPHAVYGIIPDMAGYAELAAASGRGPFVEAFRLLSGRIPRPDEAAEAGRVIAITSATSGDGKSTVAKNLAEALAQDGHAVVLVRADLHAKAAPDQDAPAPVPGLTEWLSTGKRPPILRDPRRKLSVVEAGSLPADPAALLARPQLAKIIRSLQRRFRYVLIECPPLPIVSDSMAIGKHADLLLSVVRIDHTPRTAFQLHTHILSSLGRPCGLIVNGGTVGMRAYGYGYGLGYGYGYGFGDSYDERRHPTLARLIRWCRGLRKSSLRARMRRGLLIFIKPAAAVQRLLTRHAD